jgi:hypothetical protein
MTSTTQHEFDFDLISLNQCINLLRPKSLQTLFRGLLFATFYETNLVKQIDPNGRVELMASVERVAFWSGATTRTIQRHKSMHADMVTHIAGANFTEGWEFHLTDVLKKSAIEWFIDQWKTAKCHPDKMQNVTPTKQHCHPDKMQNVTPTKKNPTSILLKVAKESIAMLAQSLESLGIAADGDEWNSLQIEDSALCNPDAVAAIARVVAVDEWETGRVFLAAVESQSKEYPWNYFRSMIAHGHFRQRSRNSSQTNVRRAETMRRMSNGTDAAAIVPTTASEAWAKVLSAIRRFDCMHQIEELRAELGPEIWAAVRAAGGIVKISRTDDGFQHKNLAAFTDAYNAQQTIAATMQPHR